MYYCNFVMNFLFQDIIVVNYDKIYYVLFRKNFYVEVFEIVRMIIEGNEYCLWKIIFLVIESSCFRLSIL